MSVSQKGSAFLLAASLCALSSAAYAQEAAPVASVPMETAKPAPNKGTTITFDSAVREGETPSPGELIKITREFGPWASVCAKTSKRAVCQFVQTIVDDKRQPLLVWGIRQDIQGRAYLVMEMGKPVDVPAGLRIQLDGMKLAPAEVVCETNCASVLPVDNIVGTWLKTGKVVRFEWTAGGKTVAASGLLDGLPLALSETTKFLASLQQPANTAPAAGGSSGAAVNVKNAAKPKPKAKKASPQAAAKPQAGQAEPQ